MAVRTTIGGSVSGRVTIKSIARDLGISHMTVSRALSGHPNVQQKTRDAVVKRAGELGYVRSAAAKAMRGAGSGIVGLLLPNIVNEFYARFANAMAQACEAEGLQQIIHLTGDDIDREEQALARLREVQAEAAVMVPAPGFDEPGDDEPGSGEGARPHLRAMRVIHLIRQVPLAAPASAVLVDDRPAIIEAVGHLARRGHRAIAFIGADEGLSSGRSRRAAFRDGLAQVKIAPQADLQCSGAPSFDTGYERARKLIRDGTATAIVCGGVEISNGALSALMEQTAADEERLAFIGYGDPAFYAWVLGGVSTIRLPVEELAGRAVELLGRREADEPPESFASPAELILRGDSAR